MELSRITSAPSGALKLAPLGALLLATGCQTEVFGGKDTYSDRVDTKDYAQEKIDAGARHGDVYGYGQVDPGAPSIAKLADALLVMQPKPASVAVLPMISYDLKTGKPWVSELGVATSDAVAASLREKGFGGSVLATEDVGLRLTQSNLERASLTTLDAVAANAHRLGADVVVFGTIRRRDRAGALDRDVLSCELQAYDVAGRRIATSTRWEVPSDDTSTRRAWDLAQTESSWMPDSPYGIASSTPGLASELERVASDLAASLARTIDPAAIQGSIYVAPLDVGGFAPSVQTLRAELAAYSTEVSHRVAASATGTAPDLSGPIVLGSTEFPSFQAAEAHLAQLVANVEASPAGRFARSFSSGLGDTIRERVHAVGKSVDDLAAIKPADRMFVEGELARGDVARSTSAREALTASGIGLLVSPRLERIGDTVEIRVDAYELAQGRTFGTGKAGIGAGFAQELRRALGQ